MRLALAILAAAVISFPALGADKPCTKPEAAKAQKALDAVVTWAQLQKASQDYRHCDVEGTSEQFTDALMRLVIDWKNVDAFATCMKDAQFKSFVHTHFKSPAAKDDLQDVYARAKSSCPKGLDAFCEELAEAAKPKK